MFVLYIINHLPEGVPVFTIAVVDDVVSEDAVASITVLDAVVNKSATLINYITSMLFITT